MKSENATIITQSTKESTIQYSEKISFPNNNESFKVYIRIRPYFQKIIPIPKNNLIKSIINQNSSKNNGAEKNMIKVEKNFLIIEDVKNAKNKNNKTFIFDNIFNETATNDLVFNEAIKLMIDKIFIGYNSTVLAYGVTGTGKTYTIFGDLANNFKDEGIIFKACDYLFEKIELNKNLNNNDNINYQIKVSYIEIYNEIVKDLINEKSPSLMIMEDPQKGVICSNITEVIITDSIQLKKIINESNKRRTMASTDQNQFSSRSHAILQMSLEKKIKKSDNNYEVINSKFLVVDLAGSERSMERGKRREEGVNINKSLFTLGNCINILSEKSNTGKFVPYRDSKLTRILKDSLGGNILTVMLACISPCSSTYDETLSTLNYAFKTKKITKKVMKNIQEIDVDNLQYKDIIDNLKTEIMQLKQIIKNQEIKLKEKGDLNSNKENMEINFDGMNNINNNDRLIKLDTININNLSNDDIKLIENNHKTIVVNEKEENKKYKNIEDISICNIDLDLYHKYIEDIINNDLNISSLKSQIESIKRNKNILENHLLQENDDNDIMINKYNSIKSIYDKYIEIVNEKLVENIEQSMIYNFNIKEITELNKTNSDKIKELESQNETGEKYLKIKEEIEYTKNNIIDNNLQKEQIYKNIQKNNEQKDELKKILLYLFENKADYSSDKYIHIIHEKDKLSKMTKQYRKEIDNFVKIQKQKEEDMMKITRKVEILRAKLKEKDKKICELEKKGGKNNYENINIKLYNHNNIGKNKINKNIGASSNKNSKILLIKTPIIRTKYNSINNNEMKNKNNKGITSKKEIILLKNENSKIPKKYHKNLNINNINNTNNSELSLKYKELIVPKTTITLTENNQLQKEDKNSYYIKITKKNRCKKTPNNDLKKIKKQISLNRPKYKRHSSSNNNIGILAKNNKRHSIRSVKVDLKQINNNKYSSKINCFVKDNSNDNIQEIKQGTINLETNSINIKEFKAEEIRIDLTKDAEINSEKNLEEKINKTKELNFTNKTLKNNNAVNNGFKNLKDKNINKFIKIISKSKENENKRKTNKRLSLQKARYENKLKKEVGSQPKIKLMHAEIFIDNYSKNKENYTLNEKNNEDKLSINTEPNFLEIREQDTKNSFIIATKRSKQKTFIDTIDSN